MNIPHDREEIEQMKDWDVPFIAQHTFESFINGGAKYLCTLNVKAE